MQIEGPLQHPHQPAGRRDYMPLAPDKRPPQNEKQTQTELALLSAGRTQFVTPRLVLSSEEAADAPLAAAFRKLSQRLRSPAWKTPLLVLLGHDPDKRRDELERTIREDEAAEAIENHLRAFFDGVLAPVMQTRETALVNTMHECVQQEMQAQQLVVQTQQQREAQLTQQIEQWEKQAAHLKAQVDRRVADNNALRKEQYRQLLMLRDIMSRQSTDLGALSALNEAIATVLAGKQQTQPAETTAQSSNDWDQAKGPPGHGWMTLNANAQVLHREKEKWEQRAKEADAECQKLRDRINRLTQENLTFRASESMPWFLKPEKAIAERQRIADAVCAYQGKWEDVGDSLVELLNNDILWAAVEQSARRGGKRRLARGLEAVLMQMDSCTQPASVEREAEADKIHESTASLLGRRRSTFAELARLIPCRACNGVGYVHADKGDPGTNDADSYLRRTLEQVLELKTQLEKANSKTLTLEGQLQLAHMHAEQLQEKLQQVELVKSTAVDSCLQTALDDEEDLDLDEIMRCAYGREETAADDTPRRQVRRNTQYEHLVVELKSTLAVKDEGLAESRKALDVAQARAVALQRALQKAKDTHAQELAMLKTSLAFSLKTRNSKIEQRQAAVKLLMKKFTKIPSQPQLVKQNSGSVLSPMNECERDEESHDSEEEGATDTTELAETTANELSSEQIEVKRMEALAQRYAEDIVRVKKEHETQQELLKRAEAEMTDEAEKRGRTNSVSQGNVVVSMASHPRDLFKALSTAQTDMAKLRRASQRSSALQTDRLLTLTTHLGHMSEELCALRKRNLAELEFWKLECEKLQNTNKALEAEHEIYRKQLQELQEDHELGDNGTPARACTLCESHKKRLMQISNELLNQAQGSRTDPEAEVPAPSVLTESERKLVSGLLLDLESVYARMTTTKQKRARELVAAHLGNALSPRPKRRTTIVTSSNDGSTRKDGASPRSAGSSPRKTFAATMRSSRSSLQLKRSGETNPDAKQRAASPSPTRVNSDAAGPSNAEPITTSNTGTAPTSISGSVSSSYHRKTLVQEILDGGGFQLTIHGLAQTREVPEEEAAPERPDNNADPSTNEPPLCSSYNNVSDPEEHEPQDTSLHGGDDSFTLVTDEPFLMNGSSDIERDPEVIQELRLLVDQSSAAKQRLVTTSWQILVLHLLWLKGEQRFQQLKLIADRHAKVNPDGFLRPISLKVTGMCDAMAQILKQRKRVLEAAIAARDTFRRDLKKAQALLIHGVAMLLESLSRKGRPTIELKELRYPPQDGSPRRSPTSNRLLYPATKVHMNHLPQTQQIPTPTFPALVGPSQQVRPSSSKPNGEKSVEGSSYNEGYHLPHRLTKSAGPRPFQLVHSTIGTLQGSMPFPDLSHLGNVRTLHDDIAGSAACGPTSTLPVKHVPVRPHSSPASRFMSTRAHDFTSSPTTT